MRPGPESKPRIFGLVDECSTTELTLLHKISTNLIVVILNVITCLMDYPLKSASQRIVYFSLGMYLINQIDHKHVV